MRASFSPPHYYGHLARGRQGAILSRLIRRLGLDRLGLMTASLSQKSSRILTEGEGAWPASSRGVDKVLLPLPEVLPRQPTKAAEAMAIRVRPSELWLLLEGAASIQAAIAWTAWRFHLDAIERDWNKSLLDDALGDEAGLITITTYGKKRIDGVQMRLEVKDPALLMQFFGRFARMAHELGADASGLKVKADARRLSIQTAQRKIIMRPHEGSLVIDVGSVPASSLRKKSRKKEWPKLRSLEPLKFNLVAIAQFRPEILRKRLATRLSPWFWKAIQSSFAPARMPEQLRDGITFLGRDNEKLKIRAEYRMVR